MGLAVACVSVTQRARVLSPVGTSFLDEIFPGFFLTCKTNVGKLHAPRSPNIICPSSSTIIISLSSPMTQSSSSIICRHAIFYIFVSDIIFMIFYYFHNINYIYYPYYIINRLLFLLLVLLYREKNGRQAPKEAVVPWNNGCIL